MQQERMATLEELREAWLWAKWLRQIENYNNHNRVEILGFEEEVA